MDFTPYYGVLAGYVTGIVLRMHQESADASECVALENKVTSRCRGSDTNLLGGLLLLLLLLSLFDARSTNPMIHLLTATSTYVHTASVHMQGHTWSELEVNQQPYPHRYLPNWKTSASYETQTSWPVD